MHGRLRRNPHTIKLNGRQGGFRNALERRLSQLSADFVAKICDYISEAAAFISLARVA
jgi:hypothetical protein